MANNVFANGREISCKAADGQTICAFPDVCLSPPSPPAGPLPIPYPNTGLASDTSGGSKSVRISGQEVMIKDSSFFKKSTGDEAATKSLGMGVITHTIQGKVYFTSWSMNVKVEDENAVRHEDLTTHNHNPATGQSPPWLHKDKEAAKKTTVCADEKQAEKDACKKAKPNMVKVKRTRKVKGKKKKVTVQEQKGMKNCSKACKDAKACVLKPKKEDKKFCCTPQTTGHHLVEVHCFTPAGGRSAKERLPGFSRYDDNAAPCVCASEARSQGTHGILHAVQGAIEGAYNSLKKQVRRAWPKAGRDGGPGVSKWTYAQAREAGVFAHKTAFPHCNSECIRRQLDAYHKQEVGCNESTGVRTDRESKGGKLSKAQKQALDKETDRIRGVTSTGTA